MPAHLPRRARYGLTRGTCRKAARRCSMRWIVAGELTVEDVWTRLRLALEAGNVGVAKRINEYLPENQALNDAPA